MSILVLFGSHIIELCQQLKMDHQKNQLELIPL